jgi:hypothetical protein
VATIANPPADGVQTIRYVETNVKYEDLGACADGMGEFYAALNPWMEPATGASQTVSELWQSSFDGEVGQAASRPTSRPAARGRRRTVVKATRSAGATKTQVVLTKEDAEKLRTSPEGASLLKNGQVIVVVDSAAAGIQGRGREADEEAGFATVVP